MIQEKNFYLVRAEPELRLEGCLIKAQAWRISLRQRFNSLRSLVSPFNEFSRKI